jgi:hypothetical protein
MRGAITPLPQYAFMAWCLVKHRDNFTFTFSVVDFCVSVIYVLRKIWSNISGESKTVYHKNKQYITVIWGCIQKFLDWVDYEITTTKNTRWEATQRVMAADLTRLTHKIAIQLQLVAESCTICSSRSRRPVRKLSDTPSYFRMASISFLVLEVFSCWIQGKVGFCYWRPSAKRQMLW